MARDRKRARQRQQRRVPETTPASDAQPLRQNLPGSLQHTGEVDEFDAALVRGARPQAEGSDTSGELGRAAPPPSAGSDAPAGGELASASSPAAEDDEGVAVDRPRRSAPARRQGGNRAVAFLRASWAELQRVQWPDRRQVAQATAVVLGFVVVAGLYLGVADWVAQKVVNFVL